MNRLFNTIVRLMWAKAHQERVSSNNPTLKRRVKECTPVLDFSLNPNILVGQQSLFKSTNLYFFKLET